mgnify:CR=1 FL=1
MDSKKYVLLRASIGSSPLQNVQMTTSDRFSARVLIPVAAVLTSPLLMLRNSLEASIGEKELSMRISFT